MQFIFSHADLVDADLMQEVIYNQDRAITLALIQIHDISLRRHHQERKQVINNKNQLPMEHIQETERTRYKVESYAEIVRKPYTQNPTTKPRTMNRGGNTEWQKKRKLFFTNFLRECYDIGDLENIQTVWSNIGHYHPQQERQIWQKIWIHYC